MPTVMMPSAEIAAGTLAARAGSFVTAAAGFEALPLEEAELVELGVVEPPQAARVRASAVAPVSRTSGERLSR